MESNIHKIDVTQNIKKHNAAKYIIVDSVITTLKILTKNEPNAVVEVRLLPKKKSEGVFSGYFDAASFHLVPALLEKILTRQRHTAYVTLHSLHPGLLARYYCRLEERPDLTTGDSEILRYRWLFVDLDPVRPSGINATTNELKAAIDLAAKVKEYCTTELELADPVEALSGNGAHLLFPIDEPVTPETTAMLKGTLQHLSDEFSNEICKVDTTNFNPARITKFYGTYCSKGDGTADRPGRMSKIVTVPECVRVE